MIKLDKEKHISGAFKKNLYASDLHVNIKGLICNTVIFRVVGFLVRIPLFKMHVTIISCVLPLYVEDAGRTFNFKLSIKITT